MKFQLLVEKMFPLNLKPGPPIPQSAALPSVLSHHFENTETLKHTYLAFSDIEN